MPLNEYKPGSAFSGVIGRTADVSSPAWPEPPGAVPGSPNVLTIVLDDTGYGQLGCYGSPMRRVNPRRLLLVAGDGASPPHGDLLIHPSRRAPAQTDARGGVTMRHTQLPG